MTITPEELPHSTYLSQREQATERIKELIHRGKFSSQGYLPSIRKTAELIGLNRDAVWRAFSDLEKSGYIQATANKRYEIHPAIKSSQLRTLDIRLIVAGEDSIRFAGLQRFHKTLVENESLYGIRTHLKCVVDAGDIDPSWLDGMDGLVLAGYFDHPECLSSLTARLPCIGIITSLDCQPDVAIDSDNRLAGELAANRLIEANVRKPCIIAYAQSSARHMLRKLGFETRWVESGRPIDALSEHWIDPSNTYKRVIELERIARNLGNTDCVFSLGKESAIDLLSILEHQKVRVPEDIRVISVDGTFDGLKTTPKLTYVKQRFEEMASIAAEKMRLLCSSNPVNKSERKTETILVAPKLVIRESA